MTVINDIYFKKETPSSKQNAFSTSAIFGDLLTLGGSFLYALSNILQEYLLKSGGDVFNYLGHLGVFGCLIAMAESCAFQEYKQFDTIDTTETGPIVGFYIGFALVNLCIYTIIPFYVRRSGATLLNISNLTTILWSMLFDIFLFKEEFVSIPSLTF